MAHDKGGRSARIGIRLPEWQQAAMRDAAHIEGVTMSDAFVTAVGFVLSDPALYALLRFELGRLQTTPEAHARQSPTGAHVQRKRKPPGHPANPATA